MQRCHTSRQRAALPVAMLLAATALSLLSVSRPGLPREFGVARTDRIPATLTIATLNLWHDYPHYSRQQERLETALEALHSFSPDLLCLQEASRTPVVDHAAAALASGLEMTGVYARANGNRNLIRFEEGEAVLAQGALVGSAALELRPRAGFFEHRLALWATVETEAGPVVVFSTHLTNQGGAINAAQMGSLVELVERERHGLPAIVAGDFNADETTPQIAALPAHWHDAGLFAGREAQLDTPSPTSLDSGRRIDYIFLVEGDSADWGVLDAGTFGGEALSDHLGVWVRVNLTVANE